MTRFLVLLLSFCLGLTGVYGADQASSAGPTKAVRPSVGPVVVPVVPSGTTPVYLPLWTGFDSLWTPLAGSAAAGFRMTWTMINVCPKEGQADAHLLQFPGGLTVLVDAGEGHDAGGALVSFLTKACIRRTNTVVLTHMHWDHYGKLVDLINSGIKVERVALNLPGNRSIADAERPWGCDWDDVQKLLHFLSEHGVSAWTPKAAEKIVDIGQGDLKSVLEVICCYDGISSPVGRTDINDTSIILRLRHGQTKAILAGDLNGALGDWLARSPIDVRADILKVPHHGTEGLAPDTFFDRVAPRVALVPAPKKLWLSDRSKRPRTYFAAHRVPVYVSGIDGTVQVTITGNDFEVATRITP